MFEGTPTSELHMQVHVYTAMQVHMGRAKEGGKDKGVLSKKTLKTRI